MAAWDEGFLQKAVDQCTNPSGRVEDCPIFDLQSEYESQQCTFQPPAVLANDNPQGPRHGLPGNVPIFNPTVTHSNMLCPANTKLKFHNERWHASYERENGRLIRERDNGRRVAGDT